MGNSAEGKGILMRANLQKTSQILILAWCSVPINFEILVPKLPVIETFKHVDISDLTLT